MNILHIAAIMNNPFSGVCVAVPAHIQSQKLCHEVALLNIKDEFIAGIAEQFLFKSDWKKSVSYKFKNPDIVIFHEVYHLEFVRISDGLKRESIPYVIIPHGSLVKNAQEKKKLKKFFANLLFFNRFINSAIAIQCLSENEKNSILFNVPKFVGTNGIKIPDIYKQSFNENKLVITYIGRLEIKVKGLDLLIDALNSIREDLLRSNVVVNIYGPDYAGRYAELKGLIKANKIDDLIHQHHEVIGEEKEKILLGSDIFIQTSRNEGMPMGILEAMSYGLPCIITEGTSLGHIVATSDTGWVAETNAQSIALTILHAISEKKKLQQKSKNARSLIQKQYSWSIISRNNTEIYKKLIK